MSDYVIREASPDDGASILDYLRLIADEPNNGIFISSSSEVKRTLAEERDMLKQYADDAGRLFLVAVARSEIIGVANCRPNGKTRGHRHTLGFGITVHVDWREQGVGTALLQRMISWCEQHPRVKRLELEVFANNPRAIHVYTKLGFQHEGTRRQAFYKEDQFLDVMFMGMVFDKDVDTSI